MKINFKKFSQYYKLTAAMLLNVFLFFVLANIVGFIGLEIRENYFQQKTAVAEKYRAVDLTKVYPGFSSEEIAEIQKETEGRPYVYEPFIQFRERPYSGKYVNVSEAGFRLTKNQGPWPPDSANFNVFLFGGSPAFGYGLPDEQTIASYLQDYLSGVKTARVAVYNFAQSGHFSTQERIFFEQLLIAGYRPHLAVFIDGLNEFYFYQGRPKHTEYFEQLQQFADDPSRALSFAFAGVIKELPVTRLARFLGNLLVKNQTPDEATAYDDPAVIGRVINNYLENKKLIEAAAAAYRVKPVFVWQPVPNYQYDLRYHLFAANGELDLDAHNYAQSGYARMAEFNKNGGLGNDFFWAADMQAALRAPLYVDRVHYTAEMSRKIAEFIGDLLVKRAFLY